MRPEPIVLDASRFDDAPGFPQVGEPFQVQAFISELAIEALDMPVLHRIAPLDEEESHLIPVSPSIERVSGEFRPVVGLNDLGQTTRFA